LPADTIQDNVDETLRSCAARSIPGRILTDREHVVRAEGFGIDELDAKLGDLAPK
jgi:hypothetical protein